MCNWEVWEGGRGRCCKPSPVGSRCGTPEHFVYFVFWIAQNFALTALWQRTVAKAHTRNQNLWGFGGLSLGSQTGIPASKELWIQHCKLFLQRNKYFFSIYIYIYIYIYLYIFQYSLLNNLIIFQILLLTFLWKNDNHRSTVKNYGNFFRYTIF